MTRPAQTSPLPNEAYSIALVATTSHALAAAHSLLEPGRGGSRTPQTYPRGCRNSYTMGQIKQHRIVILRTTGDAKSIHSAIDEMLAIFPNIRFWVSVGTGSGVPHYDTDDDLVRDIRLGDVVVGAAAVAPRGTWTGTSAGGVQGYDYTAEKVVTVSPLQRAPGFVREALGRVQDKLEHYPLGPENQGCLQMLVDRALAKCEPLTRSPESEYYYGRPHESTDRLFRSEDRAGHTSSGRGTGKDSLDWFQEPWSGRAPAPHVDRIRWQRQVLESMVHYGTIASSCSIKVRNAAFRDMIRDSMGAVCLDSQGGSLPFLKAVPGLFIRGVADYGDRHADRTWRGYASLTAAVFAREVIVAIPAEAL